MPEESMGHVCPPSVIKWLNSPLRRLLQNPRKIFGTYVNPGNTVIDLGCGGGLFTVALAEMVGKSGRVIAVDLQEEMLRITRNFATKKGVMDRITLHQCSEKDIGLTDQNVDFALAFYVVHEVPDRKGFLSQVAALLKPDATFMLIEPKHHVKAEQFDQILGEAKLAGLDYHTQIKMAMSRGMVFTVGS
ncbi:SAM-dependent methyltransferase [candidate division LCP-89 bacterium B3_LCP]|uniref:SAM-dependent methyltransferase n=1 Tax=candidate division LCP-89 bacterium B3_LCP TaxID=2012998 RepID=A0A532USV4_UNCL8|nr:MAG: SAM-dependent methyltransferase [candidate division LCP-89 bacterium B3_LCP]